MPGSFFPGSIGAQFDGNTFVDAAESSNVSVVNAAESSKVKIVHNHSSSSGTGFNELRSAAVHEAMRDSPTRELPRCFEGTRLEYRREITSWGKGEWRSKNSRVLWMDGPAGVGKSAVAQTWTEELEDRFAAAFFFSRANGWNKPSTFLPTIAYQLATRYPSYRHAVDAAITRDPLILQASIPVQFRELIVKPLREISSQDRAGVEDAIIVVDGLDECNGLQAQSTIINVVITSASEGTSPFLWGFFTRPESTIVTAFSSFVALKVTWRLTLPVRAHHVDQDMEAYLRDGFHTIRVKHPSISPLWPPEESLNQLIEQSYGLFVYGTSAIRYIDQGSDSTRLGPEERLQLLLDRGKGPRARLSQLDQLYLLIMDLIPKTALQDVLLVLYANHYFRNYTPNKSQSAQLWQTVPILSSLLGFSNSAFYDTLSPLHSVLKIASPDGNTHPSIRFYHASFTDFLTTVERSTEDYHIMTNAICSLFYSACVSVLLSESPIPAPPGKRWRPLREFHDDSEKVVIVHQAAMETVIVLPSQIHDFQLSNYPQTLEQLSQIDWGAESDSYEVDFLLSHITYFSGQIPHEWRRRIVNPKNILNKLLFKVLGSQPEQDYVLGRGTKRALLKYEGNGSSILKPYFQL
ncbi:hypothetical protein NP233_g12610 [Leucocoprinus birnbaumii]|uniref:Nephrocystin 3-like N-terminal domain-containing protein n=1 Tax=Leucocoprinus birnbaumii TaxID=56174 RepID=A0AAD5YPV6_9AGAR|nr:hypothetical protein NP233_g12610 [Leucocoprinus birnbaumii]